ncbi:MAG TPA: MFS transporter [Gemmataceae bacterium]|jgi:ACS family hexuronate transporter-like MFS transporter|nr:MFS transporter [Gemmataceae bacterium]
MTDRPGGWKWWVCGALLLATMLNYMDRQTLALTATQLKSEIQLTDARYGVLGGWFSYAFAFGSIFFGYVADRVGPRRLYPFVLIGWSAAGILSPVAGQASVAAYLADPNTGVSRVLEWVAGLSVTPASLGSLTDYATPGLGEYRWLFACRTMLGLFEAGHWPCALITARNLLTAEQRPLGNSILQSGASLGAVLTPFVVQGIRATGAPWQAPFLIIGIVGLFWVPLWLRLIRPGDLQYAPPPRPAGERVNAPRLVFQFLVLTTVVVTISLAWQFQREWLPKYLKEYHGYSEAAANYFTSGYYIVADVGCLFFGGVVTVLTGRAWAVRWARVASFAGCCALVALAALVPVLDRGPVLLVVLVLVGAGSLGAHPQYYALSQELPARHMGMLSGVLAASSWVVVGSMQVAIGGYIERTKSYDLPLIVTGLAPLFGLLAMVAWAAFGTRGRREQAV